MINANYFFELIKNNKKISETVISELIRRLVRESINSNVYTRFPVGDDIYNPGWDGIIKDNPISHRFIPAGNSLFEIGTNKGISNAVAKLKNDFEKRSNNPTLINKKDYTLVLITTFLLDSNKKEDLTNCFKQKDVFKDVLILDAIDITNWMEDHIEICIWFLKKYGKNLDDFGITLLEDEWERISNCTEPHLNTILFKIGNEGNAEKLIEDLRGNFENKVISISSRYYGSNFAFAFCISSLIDSNDSDLKERTIIVNDQASLNYINSFCTGKIVLVNFNCNDNRFTLHLNNTYLFFDSIFGEDISLKMFTQKDFIDQIINLGFTSSEANKIGFNTDYNVLALRRLLSKIPTIKTPNWCKNHEKNDLITLMLLGEINMDNKGCVQFVKTLVGENLDDYTEKLNLWAEMNDSPILKFDNIYRIGSRKESFDFIQVDIFSIKLSKLEKMLEIALSEVDDKYTKAKDLWHIHNNNYLWERRIIENIVNGFIILSEKNKRNQFHFDSLVLKILVKTIGNLELSFTIAQFMPILAELSPSSFISYLNKYLLDENELFVNFINTSYGNSILENKFIYYVFWSLGTTLKGEKTALNGLKLMLDIYYLTNDKFALDEIIKYLSPLSTMCSLIAIPLAEKIRFFFNYIDDKPIEITKTIVNRLYGSINENIMIGDRNTYRTYESKEIKVYTYEIFDMQSKCFQWKLNNETNNSELLNSFKEELNNMNITSQSEFKLHLKEYEKKILACDDNLKALACVQILRIRENILKFDNRHAQYSNYLEIFDSMLKKLQPADEYMRTRYLLIDDDYPFTNPIKMKEENWYEKEFKLREREKENCLSTLISSYGKCILRKLIEDCGDNYGIIWKLIYKYSDNHVKDVEQLIKLNYSKAINAYFRYFNLDEIKQVINLYNDLEIVINNLPYVKEVYTLIDGNPKEKGYWENQYFREYNEDDFEYLFNKFLKFAPFKLLDTYSYFFDMDYNHCIQILNAIIELIGNPSSTIIRIISNYSLEEFINKMDSKYYTEELSLCEFKLLPILKGGLDDYPMGIKKYFWNNPNEFAKLLVHLQSCGNELLDGSLGKKILFEAIMPLGDVCFIPKEYLNQQKGKVKWWVESFLKDIKSYNTKAQNILLSAVVNTLSSCPKSITDVVWPNKEVADSLEFINSLTSENEFNTSLTFCVGFLNRRGIRYINDGTPEKKISEEFATYAQNYLFSNPVTSEALNKISSNYDFESNTDMKNAVLGND